MNDLDQLYSRRHERAIELAKEKQVAEEIQNQHEQKNYANSKRWITENLLNAFATGKSCTKLTIWSQPGERHNRRIVKRVLTDMQRADSRFSFKCVATGWEDDEECQVCFNLQ